MRQTDRQTEKLVLSCLSSLKIVMGTQVQILDEVVCILFRANTLGKGTYPTIPSRMNK